jgi:phosphatidylglycerol phospholipase C
MANCVSHGKRIAECLPAPWTTAHTSSRDATRYIPQAIAHRGYKAKYPENSMAGFKAAVEVGAHAIETDLHLSKDGVVVLTHVLPRSLITAASLVVPDTL